MKNKKMLFLYYQFLNINFSLFLILFNIILYILIFFFIFFYLFLFNLNNLKIITQLNNLNVNNFFFLSFIFSFLSFSGMPPLLGFFSKFFIIIYFIIENLFLFLFLFFFINIFLIFFYIQNIKFIIKKKKIFILNFNKITKTLTSHIYVYLVFFFFLNLFSIFFLEFYYVLFLNLIIF